MNEYLNSIGNQNVPIIHIHVVGLLGEFDDEDRTLVSKRASRLLFLCAPRPFTDLRLTPNDKTHKRNLQWKTRYTFNIIDREKANPDT